MCIYYKPNVFQLIAIYKLGQRQISVIIFLVREKKTVATALRVKRLVRLEAAVSSASDGGIKLAYVDVRCQM